MEGSDEARAVAKQTREMLSKRKREGDASTASTSKHVKVSGGAAADPLLESKKACTHKVAIPEGFDVSGIDLDEDVYGAPPCASSLSAAQLVHSSGSLSNLVCLQVPSMRRPSTPRTTERSMPTCSTPFSPQQWRVW